MGEHHTPTPWRFAKGWMRGRDNERIAEFFSHPSFDDQQFIERAVNCHDDLVAALKALTTTLRHCGMTEALMSSVGGYRGPDGNFVYWVMSDLMEQAEAALAKADAGTVRLGEIGE